MQILAKPFGEYETNCYIVKNSSGEIIIDPGIGATQWVVSEVKSPLAVLNTHGHFDHVWSNGELKRCFATLSPAPPLICPFGDVFMLQKDQFNTGQPTSEPDIVVFEDLYKDNNATYDSTRTGQKQSFLLGNFEVSYQLFSGHTPGCSIIFIKDLSGGNGGDIKEAVFSGDFIFYRSIGRSDFPYSNPQAMRESLEAFEKLEGDCAVFPGHGQSTTLKAEQRNIPYWIARL